MAVRRGDGGEMARGWRMGAEGRRGWWRGAGEGVAGWGEDGGAGEGMGRLKEVPGTAGRFFLEEMFWDSKMFIIFAAHFRVECSVITRCTLAMPSVRQRREPGDGV